MARSGRPSGIAGGVMSSGSAARYWMLIAVLIGAGWAARVDGGYTSVLALNDRDPDSFYMFGHGYLDIGPDSVQANSNASRAAFFQGTHLALIAGAVNVVGGYDTSGSPPLSTQIKVGRPYLFDPLGNLPSPEVGEPTGDKITGSGTFYPGYYSDGLKLFSGNNVTLMPGLYVLDNGFELNGTSTLFGEGVMFYIRSGAISDNGTGSVFLAPPSEGLYRGITFFQAHNNTN